MTGPDYDKKARAVVDELGISWRPKVWAPVAAYAREMAAQDYEALAALHPDEPMAHLLLARAARLRSGE